MHCKLNGQATPLTCNILRLTLRIIGVFRLANIADSWNAQLDKHIAPTRMSRGCILQKWTRVGCKGSFHI